MKINEALRLIKNEKGWKYTEIAKELGITKVTAHNTFSRGNCRISTLIKYCKLFDYEIQLVPRHGANKKERTYIIDTFDTRDER